MIHRLNFSGMWAVSAIAIAASMAAADVAHAGFIGGLDGVSNSSVFETGVITALPDQGWTNVSSTARVFDAAGINGSLIALAQWDNYEVQYDTESLSRPTRPTP